MKNTSKFLSSILVTALFAALLTACSDNSGGEPNVSDGSDMPQISVDISGDAQTTPEPPSVSNDVTSAEIPSSETLSEPAPEITSDPAAESTISADTMPPETSPETDRNETSVIEETSVSEAAPPSPENQDNLDSGSGVNNAGNTIVQLALAQEGKPFFYGGADPETGFDNSGLMYYVLNQNGVTCPRLTNQIAEMGDKISYGELQAGDLVFFEYEGSGKADFGGIYIGDGAMIVSTDEDRPVSKVDITTNYYQRTFQYGIKIGR